MTSDLATSFANAKLFGATIADSFTSTHLLEVRLLAGFLVVAMTATTFLTQRQLMSKNMPADAMTGQYAQQQKMLLYVLPVVFAVGGIAFPLGVLLYWSTSNLWTMGQQFYVIRNNPTPGTPAYEAKKARDAQRRRATGPPPDLGLATAGPDGGITDNPGTGPSKKPKPPPRSQPKKQSRKQRKRGPRQPSSDDTEPPDDRDHA
jgi:YidC/Oxa1 family membrane protein insertase